MQLLEPVFADRSERAKLRVTGPQREWFLHQVLTQAVEGIAPGEARDAALITVHGRMTAYLELLATADALLAHSEAELREVLVDELRRYVFATRVEIDDVTDDMGLVLVAGAGWPGVLERAGEIAPLVHPSSGLGEPAAYLWVARADVPRMLGALERAGARCAGEDELERARVANGAPRWGRDITPKTLPQEVGIDELAVHYDKGCYLGQEAMAKIHFRGRVNRRLRRLRAEGRLDEGAEVVLGEQSVGKVTSAADGHALALLRRTVAPGARVTAGDATATVVD